MAADPQMLSVLTAITGYCTLFGAGMLWYVSGRCVRLNLLAATGTEGNGQILEVSRRKSRKVNFLILDYDLAKTDGEHEKRREVLVLERTNNPAKYAVGAMVPVIYLPENPKASSFKEELPLKLKAARKLDIGIKFALAVNALVIACLWYFLYYNQAGI